MTKTLKTAVIGAGHLGQYHAQKYAKLADSELVAVVDIDQSKAKAIANKNKCQSLEQYQQLAGMVDAVSIVTPTSSHYDIGQFFLNRGVHVLMEKPITESVEQAEKLITLAKQNNCKLQVGFLERFNPIIRYANQNINKPQFIESTRIMPFNPRNKDVNVVLDLMIHDIDLICQMVGEEITSINASGACVLTDLLDIVNARIQFVTGCVANVTASRISMKTERKMRVFQSDAYLSLDLHKQQANIYSKGAGEMFPGVPNIARDTHKPSKKNDALEDEIAAFLAAIIHDTEPVVTGHDGKLSLESALSITAKVHDQSTMQQ